ncbi:MAG: hypothetical protein KC449_25670, partial [Anaerolineales bacterium]|nr:hypothetical protein [Anaerolineales bacterium]
FSCNFHLFTLCAYLFTQAHAEDHAAITQFDENGAIFFLEPVQNASSGVWYGRYENVTAVFFCQFLVPAQPEIHNIRNWPKQTICRDHAMVTQNDTVVTPGSLPNHALRSD